MEIVVSVFVWVGLPVLAVELNLWVMERVERPRWARWMSREVYRKWLKVRYYWDGY